MISSRSSRGATPHPRTAPMLPTTGSAEAVRSGLTYPCRCIGSRTGSLAGCRPRAGAEGGAEERGRRRCAVREAAVRAGTSE